MALPAMARLVSTVVERLSVVRRFNATPCSTVETVSEHLYDVTLFSYMFHHYLARHGVPASLERVLCLALFHDLDEAFTGDILYGVKHQAAVPEIREALHRVSVLALRDLLSAEDVMGMDQSILSHWEEAKAQVTIEARIVKLADVASILSQAKIQERLGNQHFFGIRERAERRFVQLVAQYSFPAEFVTVVEAIRDNVVRDLAIP